MPVAMPGRLLPEPADAFLSLYGIRTGSNSIQVLPY